MSTTADTGPWVPAVNTFDARLALIRHQMKWNVKEAALACGLPQGSWREWELSGRRPRDYEGVCKQIAARSGCNLIWLMAGNLNPPGMSIQPDGCVDNGPGRAAA